jgi:hypothetical protein
MSGSKAKQLRRRAEDLLIEWLRTMVPDGEDTSKIHRKNLHLFANRKFLISAYSLRWFYKKVKRNPSITIGELNA